MKEKKKQKVCCFGYHDVTDSPEKSGFLNIGSFVYKHSVAQFQADVAAISRHVKCNHVVTELADCPEPEIIMMSFDDGGCSATQIADILESHRLRGHFFVATSFIGQPTFLAADQIVDLRRRGHLIGSHSHTHTTPFYHLDVSTMLAEWSQSRTILEDILQEPVVSCAVPGGDACRNTFSTAGEAGYRFVFTSDPSFHPIYDHDLVIVNRIMPTNKWPTRRIERFAKFDRLSLLKQQAVRNTKCAVKKMLGPVWPYLLKYREKKVASDQ